MTNKRKNRNSNNSDQKKELNNNWLLSYSDLMTLMFGFFVILYALSQDKDSDFDFVIKSIGVGAQKHISGNHDVKINKLTKEFNKKSLLETITDLEQKNSTLQNENKKLSEENKTMSESLKTKGETLAQGKDQESAQKNAEIEELKDEIQKVKEQGKDQQKSISEELKQANLKISEQKKELEKLTKDKQESERSFASSVSAGSTYLSTMAYWSTKDHDIDLSITTPKGNKYNFKQRKHLNSKAEFILDTRRGPGAEIWHEENAESGVYSMEMVLYSEYGNTEKAIVSGHLSSIKGAVKLPEMELDMENRKKKIQFKLSEAGEIEVLN